MHIICSIALVLVYLAISHIPSLVGQRTTYLGNRLTLDLESHESSDLNNIFKRFPKHVFFGVIFIHFYLFLSKIENGVLFSLSWNSFRY